MNPEDVPDALIAPFAKRVHDFTEHDLTANEVRSILAVTWPEIERRVREQVATEARVIADHFGAAKSAAMQAEAATLRWFAEKAARGGA